MMGNRLAEVRGRFIGGLLLVAAGCVSGAFLTTQSLVRFPLLGIAVGILLTVAVLYLPERHIHLNHRAIRGLDILVWSCIVLLMVTSRFTAGLQPLPTSYFLVFLLLVGLLTVRYIVAETGRPLLPTIAALLVTRVAIYNHAYVVGTDTRFHLGITGYVLETGSLIPAETHYYHSFPGAHLLAATIGSIGGLGPRLALFAATGFVLTLATAVVFALTRRWIGTTDPTTPLFAALLVGLSATVYQYSAMPYAQALSLALLPVFAVPIFLQDIRFRAIQFIAFGAMLITHNLTPLLAALLVSTAFFVRWACHLDRFTLTTPSGKTMVSLWAVTFSYYIVAGYTGYIVVRARNLISFNSVFSTASNPLGGEIPQVRLVDTLFPAIFSFSLSMLIRGTLLLSALLVFVYYTRRSGEGAYHTVFHPQGKELLLATGFLGIIGVLFFAGRQHGMRAFGAAALVIAPFCAHQLQRLSIRRWGIPIVVVLVLTAGLGMVIHPNAAATTTTGYKPLGTESQFAGLHFAQTYSGATITDNWMASSVEYRRWAQGTVGTDTLESGIRVDRLRRSTVIDVMRTTEDPFLLNAAALDRSLPHCYTITYDSGAAQLIDDRCIASLEASPQPAGIGRRERYHPTGRGGSR